MQGWNCEDEVSRSPKITPMTPSLGFVSVMSSTTIVMLCTLLGIPVSTTQCQVMALVGGGIARGWIDHGSFKSGLDTVDFKVFRNIGLSWICTIPFSGLLSACLYAAIRRPLLGPPPVFKWFFDSINFELKSTYYIFAMYCC